MDPRWVLLPPPDVNPALAFYLAAGRHAVGRIRGCWEALDVGYRGYGKPAEAVAADEKRIAIYWYHHGHAITADAHAHGFEPWMVTKRRPRGRGFAAWRVAFLKAHAY